MGVFRKIICLNSCQIRPSVYFDSVSRKPAYLERMLSIPRLGNSPHVSLCLFLCECLSRQKNRVLNKAEISSYSARFRQPGNAAVTDFSWHCQLLSCCLKCQLENLCALNCPTFKNAFPRRGSNAFSLLKITIKKEKTKAGFPARNCSSTGAAGCPLEHDSRARF